MADAHSLHPHHLVHCFGIVLGLTASGLAATMTLLSPELLQLLAAARMAQLAQCLGLNLPDALASEPKALAHLLQRELMRVDQPKA